MTHFKYLKSIYTGSPFCTTHQTLVTLKHTGYFMYYGTVFNIFKSYAFCTQ
jgi:hypothetical protein